MEAGNIGDNHSSKKSGRHRKKHLYNSISQQMEFYFSDSNLSKDRLLSQLISEDPFIDLNIFLNFNRIKKLTTNLADIQKALSKSELIELSEDKLKVRRKKPLKVKDNVDECTVYVENISSEADHDWLSNTFSEFGTVVYVSIPKYKQSRSNKGFAFIEFEKETEAQNALDFFESIGCKMPLDLNPEELKSIATFEGDHKMPEGNEEPVSKKIKFSDDVETNEKQEETESRKRKLSEENKDIPAKKLKKDIPDIVVTGEDAIVENDNSEESEKKKKKQKRETKKRHYIRALGFRVLPKKEWKKMRNRYLDFQKKKMKEFKQYLYRSKYSQNNSDKEKRYKDNEPVKERNEEKAPKLEYQSGVIVKLKLPEPCNDVKKLKNEIKECSNEVKYVDIPLPAGSEEVFVRFGDSQNAADFCKKDFPGEKMVLEGEEEKHYWSKIDNDKSVKFAKSMKKQRGREKLLKKAAIEAANHIRFEDAE